MRKKRHTPEQIVRKLREAEAKRLKALEEENAQLKRLVAEKELDILILKEAAKGNF